MREGRITQPRVSSPASQLRARDTNTVARIDRLRQDHPAEGGIVVPSAIDAPVGRFAALDIPAFRNYFIATVVSNIGSWMQIVAQGWLVLSLTDSPFYLGLVGLV